MNLKQKTFLFVALSITALTAGYVVFSNYYVGEQEKHLREERADGARAIGEDFTRFWNSGAKRLETVAALPGLVYGLQALERSRVGKQIPAWTTLHYLFYESDIFTDGVYLLNDAGKVLWSEPPDQDLIETTFDHFDQIVSKLGNSPADPVFLLAERESGLDILEVLPINDADGRMVGLLVGAIPHSHPLISTMLRRYGATYGTAQLIDEQSARVIASTDPRRELRPFARPDPSKTLVFSASAAPSAWKIVVDENIAEAYAPIESLKVLLTAFGAALIVIAMGSLVFILRSFTRPIEVLTAAARSIGNGDLSGKFTLDRSDEIGVLSQTLDDMKTKLKSSYDLLLHSEKMALMGRVAAGIAHELNNPLTIVIGNVQLMMMQELNSKDLQSLSRIKEGADRASKIVRNLLTFARQEQPERKPVEVNSIVKKSVELRAYELRVSNIEVKVELAPNLPESLADANQLQQVFLNLIVNAEHAMIDSHGRGLLRISSRLENDRIRVRFADDGPGISQNNLQRIFEPFFTTKSAGKGTGLGLSICQGIIEEHGGHINVESTLGHGTTFTVELPTQRKANVVAAPVIHRMPALLRNRILVVEDDPQIRGLFEDILNGAGQEVETAANGRVALQLIGLRNYDLIITNVKMPEFSGPDFFKALKVKGQEERVVFLTGDFINPETLQFIESTGRPWLSKPFDLDAIARTLSDCLKVGV